MTTTSIKQTGAQRDLEPEERGTERGWILAGVGAGLSGIAVIVCSSLTSAVYDADVQGDATAITERLGEQVPQMVGMLASAVVASLLLVVFAAGLHRHLAQRVPAGSLLPAVSAGGLGLTSVALFMGAGLTSEFVFAAVEDGIVVPESAAFFGHWQGTIPWLWGATGLAALAVGIAARRYGAFGRPIGIFSLVCGVLLTLIAISPVQYMAGMLAPVWVLVISGVLLARRS